MSDDAVHIICSSLFSAFFLFLVSRFLFSGVYLVLWDSDSLRPL